MASPAPASVAQPVESVGSTAQTVAEKTKVKKTFMLHDPATFACLGKFKSTDFRYAALKAASRGYKDIRLRITDTKLVYQYDGDIATLDKPQVVKRGEREIIYTKKPSVKFSKKYIYSGEIDDSKCPEDEPPKTTEAAPVPVERAPADQAATGSDPPPANDGAKKSKTPKKIKAVVVHKKTPAKKKKVDMSSESSQTTASATK